MSKLKKLENIKILKELEFIESEFNYKNEVIHEADSNFIKTLNAYLELHPELKKMFDDGVNKKIEKMVEQKKNDEEINIEPPTNSEAQEDVSAEQTQAEENTEDKIDTGYEKIKKLYREIAKITHPDKVKNKKLNSLYIEATKFYESRNILGLYNICNELNIEYDIEDSDTLQISDRIVTLRDRIKFLESTFTWKWHHSDDPKERESILIKYITSQLPN